MNISAWLLQEDEKFWSTVKDEHKRLNYLKRLYRNRLTSFLLMLLFILVILIFWFMEGDVTGILLLFGAQGLIYLDTESRIRIIRLYELLSRADKKS